MDLEDIRSRIRLELEDFFKHLWQELEEQFPEAPQGAFKEAVEDVLEEAIEWDGGE